MADLPNPVRLIRHRDLLVVELELSNLKPSADGLRLQREDPAAPAHLVLRLPSQHVAERAFDSETPGEPDRRPPPSKALAAGPTRLVFALPDGHDDLPLSIDALLDWDALQPRLAPGALPAGATDGPRPALPAADETAIEFPYRLILSPDAGGRWVHRSEPFEAGGRTELWHTRLRGARPTVSVRALGRRSPHDAIRGSLSDRDLDDIVTLTSDFGIQPKSWAEMRMRPSVWQSILKAKGLLGFHYEPLPLQVEQIILTALGGSVRLRGAWDYPSDAQDPAALGRFGMPTPSLQQYEHVAGQGRDQFVRIVRRGFVSTGHRASIVKVTERRFEPVLLPTAQTPQGPAGTFGAVAYLRQFFKVVVQEPVLHYSDLAGGYQDGGREMPLRSLRLTTLITPRIDFPGPRTLEQVEADARAAVLIPDSPREDDVRLQRERFVQGEIERALPDRPFWITVGGNDFEFGAVGADWEAESASFTTPLMFIPYEVVKSEPSQVVVDEFTKGSASRRTRPLSNHKLAIADPAGSTPGSTRTPVASLTFALQRLDQARVDAVPKTYRPRWLMHVAAAEVQVESVARITGSGGAVAVSLAQAYLKQGLAPSANAAGVFAELTGSILDVKFDGERGGGLARPDAPVNRLSSRQGAMSDTFTKPVSAAQLKALFGDAKLFGSVHLKDVLGELPDIGAGDFAFADLPEHELQALLDGPGSQPRVPVLRTRELERDGVPYAIEARYVWKPSLKPFEMFAFDDASTLVLDSRTVTPLDGGEARSELRGELRDFSLEFAGVVRIQMQRLAFAALPGRKPDITAEGFDLAFLGPLQFINTLREIIPSDGFSDPPALSVSPQGISAGYTLGIPSVGVGVFSIENLSLSAALTIPFNDQPAGFRFAVSERHHPFIVTVSLFGGGGFFALGVGARGVESIEAAIEFGGNIALNLGVASGGVSVMAGVYFGMTGQTTTLTGYLRVGGYVSVLGLISISIEFYLAFSYLNVGGRSEVWGQASVTVSVKVACFSKSVSLTIERRFAGASGDPTFDQLVEPDDWQQYCLAFAG